MDTKRFLEYLNKELIKGDAALEKKIGINEWVYGKGLPANCPLIRSTELEKAARTVSEFKDGKPAASLQVTGWTTHHWLYFLRQVKDSLKTERIAGLDEAFHFTQSGNSEILCDWLQVCIVNKYQAAYPALEKFLLHVGRRKFIKPLYVELSKTADGKKMAMAIYERARPGYHAVAVQTIDEILGYKN
jgi:leukotriene-A4 hydrolase